MSQERKSVTESIANDNALAELPSSYVKWRAGRLGRTTDALEQALLLRLIGPVAGLRVLDAGCGDGRLSVLLAQAGAHVSAIDPDPRMVTAAGRNFFAAEVNVALVQGTVEDLPYHNDSFDVVLSVAVLCLVDEPEKSIAQMARVLKPGGRLILGELGRRSIWAAWRRIRGWLGHATWRSARFFTEADLDDLVIGTGLPVQAISSAIFYPPLGWIAAVLAPVDPWFGKRFVSGGAFLAVVAKKVGRQ